MTANTTFYNSTINNFAQILIYAPTVHFWGKALVLIVSLWQCIIVAPMHHRGKALMRHCVNAPPRHYVRSGEAAQRGDDGLRNASMALCHDGALGLQYATRLWRIAQSEHIQSTSIIVARGDHNTL